MDEWQSDFITENSKILDALVASKCQATSIGITAGIFGDEIVVTCVEDIMVDEGVTTIILKQYDSQGRLLPAHKIDLNEIKSVCPFSTTFVNPYFNAIDKERTWFF